MNRIALLGWGSLLWEQRAQFDGQHGPWSEDGPTLKLEFSRISSSRQGALTLVIDPAHGEPNRVAFTLSRRQDLSAAIVDLRKRERTTSTNIGFLVPGSGRHRSRNRDAVESVRRWAARAEVDAVIWTDLASNFAEQTGFNFSVAAAIAYLRGLDPEAKEIAATYIRRAPAFIQTPLRSAVASLA
jgi:hypothetical protein